MRAQLEDSPNASSMTGSSAMTRPIKVAPCRLRVREFRPGRRQGAGKSAGDLGREGGEAGPPAGGGAPPKSVPASTMPAQTMPRQISLPRLTASMKTLAVCAAGRAEFVGRDDRRREAGQRRRIGREIVQQRGHEAAGGAPEREADEESRRAAGESRRSAPRSPPRRSPCRSCGTSPCAARRRGSADRRSPRWCRPRRRCRARARRRGRARGRRRADRRKPKSSAGAAERSAWAHRPGSGQRIRGRPGAETLAWLIGLPDRARPQIPWQRPAGRERAGRARTTGQAPPRTPRPGRSPRRNRSSAAACVPPGCAPWRLWRGRPGAAAR